MKKLKWNRKCTILVLIMFITVTFASFNTNLFINGKAYLRVDKDIRITNIRLLETEYNGYENNNSEYTVNSVSMDVSLPRQASSLTYEVTITNVSDKRYKISDIIEESYNNKDVKYELVDASIGNIIEPHTTKTFTIKFTNNKTITEEEDVYETKEYTFDYTGGEQVFTVPYDGDYTLEVWGAQGGSAVFNEYDIAGGYGGYSKGTVSLKKNQKLYINIGGKGSTSTTTANAPGGYNGGGSTRNTSISSYQNSSGGGATHISFVKGLLSTLENYKKQIIIVAGGGGGAHEHGNGLSYPGSAGGYIGSSAINIHQKADNCSPGTGGTQTSGGSAGKGYSGIFTASGFGQGGSLKGTVYGAGGGGGYYGDGAGINEKDCTYSGNGGSGYIGNEKLSNKVMYCYNCEESEEESTKTISTEDHSETPKSNYAKEGNGYAKLTITRKIEDNSNFEFDYTGGEQTFTAPYSGVYQLETWGAQGGNRITPTYYSGGYGGYAIGSIFLNKNDTLYVNVGGQGENDKLITNQPTSPIGGYNGGGNGGLSSVLFSTSRYVNGAGGGGATHIATSSGLLSSLESKSSSILIVSGGGGGAGSHSTVATSGGGISGVQSKNSGYCSSTNLALSLPGTQTTGYAFGLGQNGKDKIYGGACSAEGNGGGGGGFYGGYSYSDFDDSTSNVPSTDISGGGGSGYIGNKELFNKVMYCYDCDESQEESTKTVTTKAHSENPKQNNAKEGNGYSRITLLKREINQTELTLDFTFEEYLNGNEYVFSYTGEPQTFTVPKTGYYQVELWGAQGGSIRSSVPGGLGAYTSGKIKLEKDEKLYVYVGKVGHKVSNESTQDSPYFNGGGYCYLTLDNSFGSTGGGATDIRLSNGNWDDFDSLKSRIMVAGGGGGLGYMDIDVPGAAGGLSGYDSIVLTDWIKYAKGLGATQTSPGNWNIENTDPETLKIGGFGYGGNSIGAWDGGGAGGSGYYGGSGGKVNSGGGGSSFISGHEGCDAISKTSTENSIIHTGQSKHYSNYVFTDTKMIDGAGYEWTTEVGTEVVGMPTYDGTSTMTGNDGNGFAKFTLLEKIPEYTFDYTGDVQEFIAPYNGIYKIELWGAQGGGTDENDGGNGGYTSGLINLAKNKKLYLYVGEDGVNLDHSIFNNGNFSKYNKDFRFSGGGSTDIRIANGEWNSFDSLKSRIMVAAGGGCTELYYAVDRGSPAGGLIGYDGIYRAKSEDCFAAGGGTQFKGGKNGLGDLVNYTQDYADFGVAGNFMGSPGSIASGGSGYFAGGGVPHDIQVTGSGAGGSSYISGHPGCVSVTKNSTSDNITFVNDSNGIACNDSTSAGYDESGYNMDTACNKHYSGYTFTDTVMIDGNGYSWDENGVGTEIVGMPSYDGRTTMIGNAGNGYAKITLVDKIDTYKINYDLDGGTLKKKRNSYTTFDDDITLGIPTKDGYTFLGWTGGKNLYVPSLTYNGGTIHINKGTLEIDGDNFIFTATGTDMFVGDGGVYVNSKWNSAYQGQLIDVEGASTFQHYFSNELFAKNFIVFFDKNLNRIETVESPTNKASIPVPDGSKYATIRFGIGKLDSNRGTAAVEGETYITKVMVSTDDEKIEYEPYITTPTRNMVIPSRSIANRTYTAVWRDDSVLCRKATTLHSSPCRNTSIETNKMCTASGYEIGETITYGSIPEGDTYVSGNAFDCDVNGDGKFNSETERFYYVTDLDANSDYAVMIYSNYTIGGIRLTSDETIDDFYSNSNYNYFGPDAIYKQLPTLEQWPNITLYNNKRQIYSKANTTSTSGGNLPIFEYDNKTSRLITYNEVLAACNNSTNVVKSCEYLLESTSFDRRDLFGYNWGQWTETPSDEGSTQVCHIDSHGRHMWCGYNTKNNHMHVKPVIEVPKSKIK